MIQPLTIQDHSQPLVLPSSNKKIGQNYFVHETPPRTEMSIPSITLCSTVKKHEVVSENKKKDCQEYTLPNVEILSVLYIAYTVLLATTSIILPHYITVVALVLGPLFTIILLSHACISLSKKNIILGVMLVFLYPMILIWNTPWMYITFLLLFTLFCMLIALSSNPKFVSLGLLLMLVICSGIGIVIYQVYPRTIHGLHASFLCSCVLACSTIYLVRHRSFKVLCFCNG